MQVSVNNANNHNNHNNPAFTSRNKIIRDANDLCRRINNEFLSVSSTRIDSTPYKNEEMKERVFVHFNLKSLLVSAYARDRSGENFMVI